MRMWPCSTCCSRMGWRGPDSGSRGWRTIPASTPWRDSRHGSSLVDGVSTGFGRMLWQSLWLRFPIDIICIMRSPKVGTILVARTARIDRRERNAHRQVTVVRSVKQDDCRSDRRPQAAVLAPRQPMPEQVRSSAIQAHRVGGYAVAWPVARMANRRRPAGVARWPLDASGSACARDVARSGSFRRGQQ